MQGINEFVEFAMNEVNVNGALEILSIVEILYLKCETIHNNTDKNKLRTGCFIDRLLLQQLYTIPVYIDDRLNIKRLNIKEDEFSSNSPT